MMNSNGSADLLPLPILSPPGAPQETNPVLAGVPRKTNTISSSDAASSDLLKKPTTTVTVGKTPSKGETDWSSATAFAQSFVRREVEAVLQSMDSDADLECKASPETAGEPSLEQVEEEVARQLCQMALEEAARQSLLEMGWPGTLQLPAVESAPVAPSDESPLNGKAESGKSILDAVREVYTDIGQDALALGVLKSQFPAVHEACGLPLYLSSTFWRYLTEDYVHDGIAGRGMRAVRVKRLPFERFEKKWTDLSSKFPHDEVSFAFELLKGTRPGTKTLSGESFELMAEDVVLNHRELLFLQGNSLFQRRYMETVITRIFYTAARTLPPLEEDVFNGTAKGMTFLQFKTSNLLAVLKDLPVSEINEERCFFSYKHFFVAYCKFYDLDAFSNLCIDGRHLLNYDNAFLNQIACERIANGCGLPGPWRSASKGVYKLRPYYYGSSGLNNTDSGVDLGMTEEEHAPRMVGQLSYVEFLWFLMSEEDRTSLTAIEYWFRVVDLDDDGVLSLFELEQLWECQEAKLLQEGCTAFEFRDIVCVALDIIKAQPSSLRIVPTPVKGIDQLNISPVDSCIALRMSDLKKNPTLAARFFDYFINVQKLLERENTNGNRLAREVDEAQQVYFQQQQFLASAHGDAPMTVPSDNRSPFARWADLEYDHYILQDELDQRQRQQQQQLHQTAAELYAAFDTEGLSHARASSDSNSVANRDARKSVVRVRRNRLRLRRSWRRGGGDGLRLKSPSRTASGSRSEDDHDEEGFDEYGSDEEEDEDDGLFDDLDEDEESDEDDLEASALFNMSSGKDGDHDGNEEMDIAEADLSSERTSSVSPSTTLPVHENPSAKRASVMWADIPMETSLSPPSASKGFSVLSQQPMGTLFHEFPNHISRLHSTSPPRSPPARFGSSRLMTHASSSSSAGAPAVQVSDREQAQMTEDID